MSNTPQSVLDEIQKVKDRKLTDLSLGGISQIPEEISDLEQLARLYLTGNYTQIPEGIGNLEQLTELYLHGHYTQIPEGISNLDRLTQLYLYGHYTQIPEGIGNLDRLTRLYLHGHYTQIPEGISNLDRLTQLYLYGYYTQIPEGIGNLEQLTSLELRSSTQITIPPPELIGTGRFADIEAIYQYFKDLRSENTSPLYEAKLLIVGEPGAGKTTLARKLVDAAAEMPASHATTRGIDVDTWEFPLPDGENFRVNIWDFGGQEIYHATHQFFLTKDSVYVLVLDDRKENDNLNYWLHTVELLSNNSPLLIVKNERDGRVRTLNETTNTERFKNIQEIKDVELKNNEGLETLKKSIMKYMQSLPHFGTELPQSWIDIRQALEINANNYVSYGDYLAICAENDLHDKDKAKIILGYLHNLGVCLHFEDDELLSKIVILKPEWATTAVYAVLDNNDVIKNDGVFTLNDLVVIWQEKDYVDMKFELLNLMKKFQLCYAIDDRKYIAPQLLEDNQSDYHWDSRDNLMLRYKYDFMPKGIVSRFIVAMHELIFDNNVWKTGVVLCRENAYAEVKENYKGNEITIRTRGFNRDGLLHTIMYEIEKLHRPFGRQLKVTKNIPCNCSQCLPSVEPEFHEYGFVNRLAQDDDSKLRCSRSLEYVDAKSLIKELGGSSRYVSSLGGELRDMVAHGIMNEIFEEPHMPEPRSKTVTAPSNQSEDRVKALEEALIQERQKYLKIIAMIVGSVFWLAGVYSILYYTSRLELPYFSDWFAIQSAKWAVYIILWALWTFIVGFFVFPKQRTNIFYSVFVAVFFSIVAMFLSSSGN